MITIRMDNKLEELKAHLNTKSNEQEEKLTKTFNNIVDDLKKEIIRQIQNEVSKLCKEIESENKMLKKKVSELSKLSIENHSKNEELEQFIGRLCLRVDGIPTISNESSDVVMNLTKSLFKEVKKFLFRKMFWIVPIELGLFIPTELAKKVQRYYCKFFYLSP